MSNSVVEYFGPHEGYSCGYCKSSHSSYSHGMWGHCLTPQDYEDLINRGWRRSGKYCYKPIMNQTCCPQYAIRCESLKFKLSKSQKKILKRMKNFLINGRTKNDSSEAKGTDDVDAQPMECGHVRDLNFEQMAETKKDVDCFFNQNENQGAEMLVNQEKEKQPPSIPSEKEEAADATIKSSIAIEEKSCKGPDPNKPRCRKAKDIRRERHRQKLLKSGISAEKITQVQSKQKSSEKTVEEFISDASVENPCHRLELRLVPCNLKDTQFSKTFEQSLRIYQNYQTNVHQDPAEKCSKSQFTRFLVTNPFQLPDESPQSRGIYGSYHQQYWLDNKLIAVGVIDILPRCVSSVYLYYDPEYNFLSLGTYAALRELALTRELHKKYPDLIYYYMGFYIHSCPKMTYKGSYSPSFLLCPETYLFKPIEICIPRLNESKYARLEDNAEKEDCDGVVNFKEVMVLYQRQAMNYVTYCSLNRHTENEDVVRQYASLVGRKCYRRILLYKST